MAKIIGHGPPTKYTPGILGSEYFDKDTKQVYTCTNVKHITAFRAGEADAEYEWSVSGGSVSSWNDFTDKPFYKEVTEDYVLPETEYVAEGGLFPIPTAFELEDGRTYVVTINGTEYRDVAKTLLISDSNKIVYLGNPSLAGMDNDNGKLFIVARPYPPQEGAYGLVIMADMPTSATISIKGEIEYIKPLPVEFLPTVVFSGVEEPNSTEGVKLTSCNYTFAEVFEMLNKNVHPTLVAKLFYINEAGGYSVHCANIDYLEYYIAKEEIFFTAFDTVYLFSAEGINRVEK